LGGGYGEIESGGVRRDKKKRAERHPISKREREERGRRREGWVVNDLKEGNLQ
jgi:hypothetical protein